jgi:predicted histidine transporter YuiF (NhaC family)
MVIYGGLSTTEWMAVLGGICAVVGLIIQLWSAYRKDQRDQQLHNKRMHEKDYEQD